MQCKIMPAIVSVIASVLLLTSLCLLCSLHPTNVSAAKPKIIAQFSAPIATATASTSTTTQTASSIDPLVIAALIGLAGVIVGALIAGAFAVYQIRRTAQIERKKQAEQFQHDQEMERLRQAEQFKHDQELERLRKELDAQYKAKEQEEQREETKAETLRLKMLLAQTNAERAKAYRQSVHANPRISRLQILDMSRPLEVTSIYVRVRVHQDVRPGYEIDRALLEAEAERDPDALFKAGFKRLESRVSSSIDPDEAIRKYKRCVFVGDPGAGKTTLLKYLTLKSADSLLADLPDLPIRIELNAFAGSGYQDLLDLAAAEWEVDYGFPKLDARSYMEENLLAGKALLLLDALDETVIGETFETAEDSYQRVADAIMQAATRYHQAPIVVTARKAGYQQRAQLIGFTELEVLDFRLEEIQQFVTNWFDCYEDPQKRANAADLNTKLQRNPRIQALAANPLLLSLIVLVYEAQLDLPDRRAEMYKECVDTLLTKWDAKRNIRRRREFKPEHKRQLLTELAWHFHLQGRRYFPESEVLAVIADFLPKVRLLPEQNGQVLAEIANEQGLLKEQARGWQGFLHLTLQEYFVAQYVTHHQQLEALLPHCGDPWWEEVTLLYAGYTPDASPILRKLLGLDDQGRRQQQDDLFQTNLILAGRCLTARPTIQQVSLWETIINRLFESLTRTRYSLTREHMAGALASVGSTEVNTRLLRMLSDQQLNLRMRESIAFALGSLGERSIASDLLHLLSNQQLDNYVRGSITLALGSLGERSIAPDLLRLLSNQQLGTSIRESIAFALGSLGERSIASDLLRLLSNQQLGTSIRESIAFALGSLGERSIAPDLLRLLSNQQLGTSIRESIAESLGSLGERSIASDLLHLLSNQRLEPSVRRSIALALGSLGERSIAPDLLHLLSNQRLEPSVRRSIALALGSLGERSIAPDLLHLLSNQRLEPSVRRSIALALGSLGERSVAPNLLRLLSNLQLDWRVRRSIAAALGSLGERSVAPDLLHLLSNQQLDSTVRGSIAAALGSLGERSVAPDLLHLLSNQQLDNYVRGSIAAALGSLGERSIAPDLLHLLSNQQLEPSVRESIAESLGVLVNDEENVCIMATLLPTTDIAEYIHRALWTASHRAGVRIYIIEGVDGEEQVDIIKL